MILGAGDQGGIMEAETRLIAGDLIIQEDCGNIDWDAVRGCLRAVGMASRDPELHRRAFLNSFAVVFLHNGKQLIGFGRPLSDGAYRAAIYDVAVSPPHQRRGLGTLIMERMLARLSHCNVILYANPGREDFYLKLGFRPMRTGMAKYLKPAVMKERGLIS